MPTSIQWQAAIEFFVGTFAELAVLFVLISLLVSVINYYLPAEKVRKLLSGNRGYGVAITLGQMIAMRESLPAQYQSLPDDVLFKGILDQLISQEALRQSVKVDVIRDRASLSRIAAGGKLENVYRLQIMNATEQAQRYRISAHGLDGLELNQAWKEGAEAYKGISVSGFPNLFLLYGPNTNLGHNSILYMLESQYAYVLGCLQALREQGLRYLDLRPTVQRHYNAELQRATHRTIWEQGCDSWYKTATGKHTNNWPGFTFTYRLMTRTPELADYDCVR